MNEHLSRVDLSLNAVARSNGHYQATVLIPQLPDGHKLEINGI